MCSWPAGAELQTCVAAACERRSSPTAHFRTLRRHAVFCPAGLLPGRSVPRQHLRAHFLDLFHAVVADAEVAFHDSCRCTTWGIRAAAASGRRSSLTARPASACWPCPPRLPTLRISAAGSTRPVPAYWTWHIWGLLRQMWLWWLVSHYTRSLLEESLCVCASSVKPNRSPVAACQSRPGVCMTWAASKENSRART